jgi:hypothetical protein
LTAPVGLGGNFQLLCILFVYRAWIVWCLVLALATIFAGLNEPNALSLITKAKLLPATILALSHINSCPVESIIRFAAKDHTNFNVLTRFYNLC